jgi:predicted TIM-barrel fold metal-dependent hydrolase
MGPHCARPQDHRGLNNLSHPMGAGPSAGWDCHVHVFDAGAATAPGHYLPQSRPLQDIEALARPHGFGHLVLVQPSVYGSDNTVLLNALQQGDGQHRGVVVLAEVPADPALEAMHAMGVRGVRFNLVSPVGDKLTGAAGRHTRDLLGALAPQLKALGWHVQWYARPEDLSAIVSLHAANKVPAVLDHLGGMHAGVPAGHEAWQAVGKLAALGAWIKLSGWYRLHEKAPYGALEPAVRRLAPMFAQRMIWGSDWPHTSFQPGTMPVYGHMYAPLAQALTAAQTRHVFKQAPAVLYA